MKYSKLDHWNFSSFQNLLGGFDVGLIQCLGDFDARVDSILGGFDASASKLLLKHRVEEKLSVFCHIQQNCNSSFSGFQQIFYQNILV